MNKKTLLIVFLIAITIALVYWNRTLMKSENAPITTDTVADNRIIANEVISYVETNIQAIATNSPVLGGTWHTTSVNIDPYANSGMVTYEDGHIQSQAVFKYKYVSKDNIQITDFTVKP